MQLMILLVLRRDSMHGYGVIKDLRFHFEGVWEPKTGAVYPALKKLQEHGLLESSVVEGKEHYRISAAGEEWLYMTLKDLGAEATMGMWFMSMLLEAHEEMGLVPEVVRSCSKKEKLRMMRKTRDNMIENLRRLDEIIAALERDDGWDQ